MWVPLALATRQELGWPTYHPPDPARWKLPLVRNEDICIPDTPRGHVECRYWPADFRRRLTNFYAEPNSEKLIHLYVTVFPALCSLESIETSAVEAMREESIGELPDAGVSLAHIHDNVLVARSASKRIAFVSTRDELFHISLNVPDGPTEQDEADFAALIDSVRSVEGLRYALRRGRWLWRNTNQGAGPAYVARCGMTAEQMVARAVRELRQAIAEEPEAWEPWALLGEEAEARGGGPDLLAALLWGEHAPRPRSFVSAEPAERPAERPLDLAAVREAATYYAEAVRRGPPRPRFRQFSELPLDRSTILVRQAQAYLRLGEDAAAEAAWREALDDQARGSWGYFEAAFMLAERAYARGDRTTARWRYDDARRGYWAFYQSDLIQSGHGPAMLARIERRRDELWNDCRVWGPFLSTRRPGCVRPDGD